ncbi:MAG: hypothetical protein HZB15_10405 [Actinobacteria bacterium]|nr:hypothetical protein [Actinomycetota bacterium]
MAELVVRSPIAPWQRIGLTFVGDRAWIGGVAVRFVDDGGAEGLVGWTLAGAPSCPDTIDGLETAYLDDADLVTTEHPLGATAIDHVVVRTSSLERTCGAIEQITGEPLKRVREAGAVRQGFHRLGPVIVEVVETADSHGEHATFWGFVLVVDDLDAAVARLGPEPIGAPRPAVQAGRSIASFTREAGLGLPVALMTPHRR